MRCTLFCYTSPLDSYRLFQICNADTPKGSLSVASKFVSLVLLWLKYGRLVPGLKVNYFGKCDPEGFPQFEETIE